MRTCYLNAIRLTLLLLIAPGFSGCRSDKSFSSVESGFRNIPDSVQTSVYWYWISDNISREGVIRDLKSMKEAGINRAFIGNIGLNDVPYGNVKMLSEEWWEIMHTALKTATELDIEIGIFNCPGWSQSGGPWVSSGEAMRYLAASETRISGPGKRTLKLEKPDSVFQDVKVLAFPSAPGDGRAGDLDPAAVSSVPVIAGLAAIIDGDDNTGTELAAGVEYTIDIESGDLFTARSLSVYPLRKRTMAHASLLVKEPDGTYRELEQFEINRTNPALNVGFRPWAPVTVSFPEAASRSFRLVIKNSRPGGGIAELVLSSLPAIERYSEKSLARMHPTPLPYWHDYQWPAQPEPDDADLVIDSSKVMDISKYMEPDGTLNWDVPAGEWVILRTGMTPTGTVNSPASPEATGYEVDKMSIKHAESHFHGHMGEILKRIPAEDRKTFRVVVQDSYETGGQNFTDDFIADFKDAYGYDPVPFFPAYYGNVISSQLESDRFLWDMRRMVADKVAYDYVGGLREASHKHGLRTWLENYGHWGFPGEFLMYGGQSDEISGEFWSEGELGNIENRAASSCGHIYGKNKISAESNTCAGNPFSRYPAVIKQRGDRFFAEGINNTLLHVYITQPYEDRNPGMNAWFGNEFNRKNTWFSQMDVYIQYLKRVNFMLQQGLNVADVAYFIGEDAPKMTGVTDPPLPEGYQFDYINAEVIEKYLFVKDGMLTLPHGTQYRALVLPKLETMRPELLARIRELAEDGAVILGPPPVRSPSNRNQPFADSMVKVMAAELWKGYDGENLFSASFGKGRIINGMDMPQLFEYLDLAPDCRLTEDNAVHYGHRKLRTGDIYFLTNQTAGTIRIKPEFRIHGMQPELWDPVTGSIRELPEFDKGPAGGTVVPLVFEAYQSVFIVFRKKAGGPGKGSGENFPEPAGMTRLAGPWTVRFDPAMRGPDEAVVFDSLADWTESSDERIRYYSGTATYSLRFNIGEPDPGKQYFLDLGRLTAMAKVRINGKYAGGVWTMPYRLGISGLLRNGENDLEIEVVSTWMNRLIGDSRLPAESRPTWCPVNPYKPESPLQPSGLFGPVTIFTI